MKYEVATDALHTIGYDSNHQFSKHLEVIDDNRVFFHFEDPTFSFFHFYFVSFVTNNVDANELYHQTMGFSGGNMFAVVTLDENEETLWHAVSISDIVYFQHNLTDFSLIGSKYSTGHTTESSYRVISISEMDGVVYIYGNHDFGMLILVNATTQDCIKIYRYSNSGSVWGMLATDGYINVYGTQYAGTYTGVHLQASTSYINYHPNFEENSTYSFSVTMNNSYDLTDQSKLNRIRTEQSSSSYSLSFNTDPVIVHNESHSYALKLDSLEQNFTVIFNQTTTESITLPCSIITYNFPSYAVVQNGVEPVPSWVTFHESNLTLDIDAPDISSTQEFSFKIQTTYVNGTIDTLFHITVEQCNIDQCEVCASVTTCDTCANGYELSSDNTECESSSNSTTNTTSTSNDTLTSESETSSNNGIKEISGPQYNQTVETFTMQIVAGTGVLISCFSSIISGASPQLAFIIFNQLQMYLMLPLMAKYMADKVRNFILSYGFVIFSFDFIPIINLKILQSAKEEFMHAQPNKYLEELGMESVSTLYNNYSLISVLIGIVILHLGISLLFP